MSANYSREFSPAPASHADSDSEGWGPDATWPETIATLLITAVALMFVTFLAVIMGLT